MHPKFRGPPYLPGEVERRAFGQMQQEINRSKGMMFTTANNFEEQGEKKEIYYYP